MSINTPLKLFLSLLSGFILSLCAPGYDLWFLAWLCISPLFIIINIEKKLKTVAACAFLFGLSYNLSCLYWLISLHPLNWLGFNNTQSLLISFFSLILVSVYNSIYFVLFAIISFYIKKTSVSPYNKGILHYLIITILWLLIFNKISSLEFLFGFPWTLIEYSQYKNLFLIQIAEYFGSISISFLIVFFNLVLADFFIWLFNVEKIGNRNIPKNPGQLEFIIKGGLFILVLISASILYGLISYNINQENFSEKSQSLCILQGNLPIKSTRGNNLDIMLTKGVYSKLINKNDSVIFIAPEGALPTILNSDLDTQNWLEKLANEKKSDFIFGSYCKNRDTLTNCAVSFSPVTNEISFYEKERLVPFGEYTPFSFLLPSFIRTFADNIIGEGFSKGELTSPINLSFNKAGINICFELIFPTIIRRHSLEGANLLVNISDLSWFSSNHIKNQFLSFAVFRAVENRKPLILATNSGISAFIEPSGKIKSQSLPNKQGVLLDWINPNDKITFYAKYGW